MSRTSDTNVPEQATPMPEPSQEAASPAVGAIEFVLALGPGRDRTDEIAARIVGREPRVHIVQRPSGRPPDALNASRSEIVVRVDGHGVLDRDYVR